jgi:hypothetical protein
VKRIRGVAQVVVLKIKEKKGFSLALLCEYPVGGSWVAVALSA